MVRFRTLFLLALCALLFTASPSAGRERRDVVERVIRPGQDELLATMLGSGVALPGHCRFAGGKADGAVVTAQYACDDGTVVLELRDPEDASNAVGRTELFAIVMRKGSAPPGLCDAVTASVRAHEARIEWGAVPRPSVAPLGFVAGIGGIALVSLLMQYLIGRRLGAATSPYGRRDAEGASVAQGTNGFRRLWRRAPGAQFPISAALLLAYLTTRLLFLTRLPVFVDESVHILWAQAAFGHYFSPEISVGKWLPIQVMNLYAFLPLAPLASARLASVSMGLATLLACILINRELFSFAEGLLAGVVYALLPFSLLYDRLALADIYLTAFGAWMIYFSLAAMRRSGVGRPLVMSLCAFAAMLSKPTGGLLLVIPPLVCVLLVPRGERAAYLAWSTPTLLGGGALLLFLLRGGYGTTLLASQAGWEDVRTLVDNLEQAEGWLTTLLTPTVALCTAGAGVWALAGAFRGRRADDFLALLILWSSVPYAQVSNIWYPRYLLPVTVPVSLLLGRTICAWAAGLAELARRFPTFLPAPPKLVLTAGATLVLALAIAPNDLALMIDPDNAPLPPAERTQYVSGWSSGYGLAELAAFLREQAHAGPIDVVRFDSAGPANLGLDLYLEAGGSLRTATIDPRDGDARASVAKIATAPRTLFISNREEEESLGIAPRDQLGAATPIWTYVRPGSESALEVWEVPRPSGSP